MFCYTSQLKNRKKLRRNRWLDAGFLANVPRFHGARADHVRIESCCFPGKLVSFDPRYVTRFPPIGIRIWVGRYNNIGSVRFIYSFVSLFVFVLILFIYLFIYLLFCFVFIFFSIKYFYSLWISEMSSNVTLPFVSFSLHCRKIFCAEEKYEECDMVLTSTSQITSLLFRSTSQ